MDFDADALHDLLVGGAGAIGATVAIAPAFSVERGSADLFHVTRYRDAQSIARDGLQPGMETPSEKQARDFAVEAGGNPEMTETPDDARAERELQELLRDAKREVDGTDALPDHDYAVFFWTDERKAHSVAEDMGFGTAVVGVDTDKMPADCSFAMGDANTPDAIFEDIWQAYRGRGHYDERELFEAAKDYWREVEAFDPETARSSYEVWTNCVVPPEAIEYIENPRTGRIIERPTEASQSMLRDFEQ